MTMCAISLGGNLGDVPTTFADAIRLLESSPIISNVRMSRLYRTAPMGAAAGDVFWNAAAVFETTEAPLDVLDQLQQVEQSCGRVRTIRWGPRTLDLDLILYDERAIDSPRLTVPHPATWHRRFVLDPLVELIPEAVHPVFQQTLWELRQRLLKRPLPVGWAIPATFQSLQQWADAAYPAISSVAGDLLQTASIGFAGPSVSVQFPQFISLPDEVASAKQRINDILTAALDEPVPV